MRGDDTKPYQKPDARETERFLTKIWQPRQPNKKAEWISNMTKELEELKEDSKVELHVNLLKTTQKISNWRTPGHDGTHGFWFKKFTSIHFKNSPAYLMRVTAQVFIPLMRFPQCSLVSSCFLVLLRYSFFLFFISACLVSASNIPEYF